MYLSCFQSLISGSVVSAERESLALTLDPGGTACPGPVSGGIVAAGGSGASEDCPVTDPARRPWTGGGAPVAEMEALVNWM